jgi:hypothetical protein
MATPRKLNCLFSFFPYSGNGGGSGAEVPDIRRWYTQLMLKLVKDERIDEIHEVSVTDTPITMSRNRAVLEARQMKCDVLVFVDSDMHPELHLGEPGIKPFFESSFDFLYDHYEKGPVVIGAPYCGPPGAHGSENVYIFEWMSSGDHGEDESMVSLEAVTRPMAARMRGIQPAAALPTGMIMYDMRAFELIEPCLDPPRRVLEDLLTGKIDKQEALRRLTPGFFYYEWKNNYAAEKASTEDVTNTRDISLAGSHVLGYNPVFCNWDSPVGHWKPWCVRGRPLIHEAESVANTYARAVLRNLPEDDVIVEASNVVTLPPALRNRLAQLKPSDAGKDNGQ